MLQPARTKYRKAHKGRIHGHASRGEVLNYGAYGLKAMQHDRVVSKQSLTGLAAQAATEVGKVAGGLSMPEMKDVPPALRAANQAGAGVVKEMTAAAMTAPALGAVVEAAQFSIGRRALQQPMTSYGGPGFRAFDWSFSLKPLIMSMMRVFLISGQFSLKVKPINKTLEDSINLFLALKLTFILSIIK